MVRSLEILTLFRSKYDAIKSCLNEKGKRLWTAMEAKNYGYGGITILSEATGLSHPTIRKGILELEFPIDEERVRKAGGGRKKLTERYPDILDSLDKLVEPTSKGDPENPLRWTSKSTRKLSEQLQSQGYTICSTSTGNLLQTLGYIAYRPIKSRLKRVHILIETHNLQ